MTRLQDLNDEERIALAVQMLQQQVIEQRTMLHRWRVLTDQPAQIDTGYVGQHLVSHITGIPGGGYRGKGLDLADGAEVKSANFLDALDKRGASSPRWNFQSNDEPTMESFLTHPAIYLVSIDTNSDDKVRARAWKVDPRKHLPIRSRYEEWMEKLGLPKLKDPKRPYANFQLFPPRNGAADTYARHGGGSGSPFTALRIQLEDGIGAHKILHVEEGTDGVIRVPVADTGAAD